jgi:RNA polymerase sigma factor (sigma-70 family)
MESRDDREGDWGDAGSVTLLIHQLRSADPGLREAAARCVWERYFARMLELARRHLSLQVRPRVDEEDVLQSVYASICRRHQRGEFALGDREDLWRLLVTVTLRKARNAVRHELQAKRDVRRERSGLSVPAREGSDMAPLVEGVAELGPGPEQAVMLAQAFEERLGKLDEGLRRVALAKLEGYTNREIGRELGCTERSVERKLRRIREIWEGEDAEAGGEGVRE